jgi:low affinity Fe/Cu permease
MKLTEAEMTREKFAEKGGMDAFFTTFSNEVAKWTGSHWAFLVAAALVVVSLVGFGVELTNIAISIVTLLMVFVLQNTQNRDSAALHLKLDEVVRVEPEARDDVRGVESKTEPEIRELTHEDPDSASESDDRRHSALSND